MKKWSLQWRLTVMTALLVMTACLVLNLLVSYSAVSRIDEIENYIIEFPLPEDSSITVGVDLVQIYPELLSQLQESKAVFRGQNLAATLLVMLVGSGITYLLAGRILKPLKRFSSRMEEIQAQNLSEPMEMPGTEDEIARLTRSFNEMLVRLNQAFTVQRQFSANAAHELRTPLAVIQTKLDVFRKREQPSEAEYEEIIEMMREQTGRLSHLVSVLLEMTELQTAERTDRISLSALAEEVLCDLAQVAEEKQVELIQTGDDAQLTGNDSLLYRAVYNLVENAVKYNRPGGTVTLEIRTARDARTEQDTAFLVVTDTGIGIAEENREKIFDPFFRVDKSRSRAMGGAGLGLALVRDIARLHGGEVCVRDSSENGTVMELSLPSAAGV